MTSVHVYCRLFLRHIKLFSTPIETVFGLGPDEWNNERKATKTESKGDRVHSSFLELPSRIYVSEIVHPQLRTKGAFIELYTTTAFFKNELFRNVVMSCVSNIFLLKSPYVYKMN